MVTKPGLWILRAVELRGIRRKLEVGWHLCSPDRSAEASGSTEFSFVFIHLRFRRACAFGACLVDLALCKLVSGIVVAFVAVGALIPARKVVLLFLFG